MAEGNGTIHPCPQLVALLPDGEGHWRLSVKCNDGHIEVWPVTPQRAALWLTTLAEHLADTLKKQEGA